MSDDLTLARQELIGFCQDLIRTRSVNGVDDELKVAQKVAAFATWAGLETEIVGVEAARPSVLVRTGSRREPSLLLVAHTDTVAAGSDESWTHEPFSGAIVGGRIYGRGAIDNKGGLVAAIAALMLLDRAPGGANRPSAMLACVPDEESGATGRLGVNHLHRLGKLHGKGAIYTYPGMVRLTIGHRGVLRLKLTAFGKTLHSGSISWRASRRGFNAVAGMAAAITGIDELNRAELRGSGYFGRFSTVFTPTVVHGGTGVSMVPDRCEAIVDVRIAPPMTAVEAEAMVRQAVSNVQEQRRPVRIDVEVVAEVPATVIDEDSDIVRAIVRAGQDVLGYDLPLVVSGPANESYMLNSLGIPTCIIGPTGRNVHAPDEYVEIDSIFTAASIYAQVANTI